MKLKKDEKLKRNLRNGLCVFNKIAEIGENQKDFATFREDIKFCTKVISFPMGYT